MLNMFLLAAMQHKPIYCTLKPEGQGAFGQYSNSTQVLSAIAFNSL